MTTDGVMDDLRQRVEQALTSHRVLVECRKMTWAKVRPVATAHGWSIYGRTFFFEGQVYVDPRRKVVAISTVMWDFLSGSDRLVSSFLNDVTARPEGMHYVNIEAEPYASELAHFWDQQHLSEMRFRDRVLDIHQQASLVMARVAGLPSDPDARHQEVTAVLERVTELATNLATMRETLDRAEGALEVAQRAVNGALFS